MYVMSSHDEGFVVGGDFLAHIYTYSKEYCRCEAMRVTSILEKLESWFFGLLILRSCFLALGSMLFYLLLGTPALISKRY